ncbi:MAG: hypothetical protein HY367_03040 [Candidatus Aenigmarchaeota archaeon]|nr:hypothetical protein [Candidatus Aenigmarchaeota archaeon]
MGRMYKAIGIASLALAATSCNGSKEKIEVALVSDPKPGIAFHVSNYAGISGDDFTIFDYGFDGHWDKAQYANPNGVHFATSDYPVPWDRNWEEIYADVRRKASWEPGFPAGLIM